MNTKIILEDRGKMTITGAVSLESATAERLALYTKDGDLVIKGSSLQSENFDPASGILRLTGRVDGICFTTDKHHMADNIIRKLFR